MTWEQHNRLYESYIVKAYSIFRVAIMQHFELMLEAAKQNNFSNLDIIVSRVSNDPIKNAFIQLYQKVGINLAFLTYDELMESVNGKAKKTYTKVRTLAGDTEVRGQWLALLASIVLDETIPAMGAIMTTSGRIFVDIVEQAVLEGLPVGDIVVTLQKRFTTLLPWRAWNIARTETLSAMNYGSALGAAETGFNYEKKWLASLDGRERPTHHEAHYGPWIAEHQTFFVGGESLRFPGDPGATAGNRVNCRCTVIRRVIA